MLLFQLLVVLASGLLCLSQQCQDEVYTNDLKYTSCEEILTKFPDTPSGYYVLADSTEKVYCDMENKRCGSQGWTRVAYVNMSSETSSCPGEFQLYETPIRSCGGLTGIGCASAKFSTHGIPYSQVCGRMIGYQVAAPDEFCPYIYMIKNILKYLWKECKLPMEIMDSIFGLMSLVIRDHQLKQHLEAFTVLVLLTGSMVQFQHSSEMIIIVTVELMILHL